MLIDQQRQNQQQYQTAKQSVFFSKSVKKSVKCGVRGIRARRARASHARRACEAREKSPYFCVFKYARAVKQKVWNEAEIRERDWGETLKIRFFFSRLTRPTGVRLVRFARVRLLRHALPISFLILRKKTTVLQSSFLSENTLFCFSILVVLIFYLLPFSDGFLSA